MTAIQASQAIVARLRDLLGEDGVATEESTRIDAAYDALGAQRGFDTPPPQLPFAVVYPRSRDDVAAIVRLAIDLGVGVVARGGGSGLMGAARVRRPAIVAEMRRMVRIRELDPTSRVAWVEAGAVFSDVDAAVGEHGLMVGHDPWTYGIATVGGAIATNGLGFLGGKYGSMGDQVLAVEAVLGDGTIVESRAVQPKSTGIDLARLFVGAEGRHGIVTAAALRLFPIPESRARAGFTFQTFERGFEALLAMHALGLAPAMLDYGERTAAHGRPGEPPTLYLGFDGLCEEVGALLSRACVICEGRGGEPLSASGVEAFWESRHTIAENFSRNRATRRAPPDDGETRCFDYIHVSLPPSHVLDYRRRALAIAAEAEVSVLETGVWVAPGLFSMVLATVAPTHAEAVARMSVTVDACLRDAQRIGGSMEYCHGAGIRLAHLLADEHGSGLSAMLRVRRALDPAGVLVPTGQDFEM